MSQKRFVRLHNGPLMVRISKAVNQKKKKKKKANIEVLRTLQTLFI